jgi:hypothetical protein
MVKQSKWITAIEGPLESGTRDTIMIDLPEIGIATLHSSFALECVRPIFGGIRLGLPHGASSNRDYCYLEQWTIQPTQNHTPKQLLESFCLKVLPALPSPAEQKEWYKSIARTSPSAPGQCYVEWSEPASSDVSVGSVWFTHGIQDNARLAIVVWVAMIACDGKYHVVASRASLEHRQGFLRRAEDPRAVMESAGEVARNVLMAVLQNLGVDELGMS